MKTKITWSGAKYKLTYSSDYLLGQNGAYILEGIKIVRDDES